MTFVIISAYRSVKKLTREDLLMSGGIFEALLGNEKLKEILAADLKNKTHSHAYIIEGAPGSGKKTLALEMCKALLCSQVGSSFPCGNCPSCRKISQNCCTDIYTLSRGDSASLSVDAVRRMTETQSFLPDEGDYKVYIIEDADKMTVQAQNAFLLSLEEPPEFVMYLLLCTDASLLLETIRSRAPVIRTQLFSNAFISDFLKSTDIGRSADDEDIAAACAVSGGAVGTALDALSGKERSRAALAKEAGEAVTVLCTKRCADRILFCASLKHSREEFAVLFDYTVLALRDLIAVKCGGKETLFYKSCDDALDICAPLKLSRLCSLFERIEAAKRDITVNNASAAAVLCSLAADDK